MRRTLTVAAVAATLMAPAIAATDSVAGAAGGSTVRVSVNDNGIEANDYSFADSISGNGQYVVYASLASNLVANDTNGRADVFLHDRHAGTTERVSVASSGDQGNGGSTSPAVSDEGRFVAFFSSSSNFSPGTACWDADNDEQCEAVYVRDRSLGTTTLVTVPIAAEDINGFNGESLAISSDGNLIAFCSAASNLIPDDTNNESDLFLRNVSAGTTERLSETSTGDEANGRCLGGLSMSGDGRYVAFDSTATNLAPGGTGAGTIYVVDRQLDTIEVRGVGGPASAGAFSPTISDDGRLVGYASYDELVVEDTNPSYDPYLEDRATGVKTLVNRNLDGVVGFNNDSIRLSGDGTTVFFRGGGLLAPGAVSGTSHLYVRSVADGTITLANVTSSGNEITNPAFGFGNPLSDNGGLISFGTSNPNVVTGDTNGTQDIFVHQLVVPPDSVAPVVTIASPVDGAAYTLDQVVNASFSCDDGGGAGVETCDGTQPTGTPVDTASAGLHTFTVTTSDGAGNSTQVTHTYEVLAGNVEAIVTGGETISTDPGGLGASPTIPVQTEISVPTGVAGQISVSSQAAGTAPSGFTLFSRELVLSGPAAPNAADPYVLTFTIDASALGSTTPAGVVVFRNAAIVADCTSPTDAAPDPCVADRAAGAGGDAVITVRTTAFSVWSLGAITPAPDDDIAPTVEIASPTAGAVLTPGQQVPAEYTCADEPDGSGITTCEGTVGGSAVTNGDLLPTDALGNLALVVTATDHAGNTTVAEAPYTVFASLGSPSDRVDPAPTVNSGIKAAAVAPVKFSLGGNFGTSIFAAGSPTWRQVSCASLSGDPIDTSTPAETPAATGLSYDTGSGMYTYRWKTSKTWAGQCWRLTMAFGAGAGDFDGANLTYLFRFDK